MNKWPERVEKIGNAHGRIAMYFDWAEAIDLAEHYGPGDAAYKEILDAVERAYPERDHERDPA